MKKVLFVAAIAIAAIAGTVGVSKTAKAYGDYPGGNCILVSGGSPSCPFSPFSNCQCIN